MWDGFSKVDIVMLSNDSDELALPDNHESYCVTLGARMRACMSCSVPCMQ